MVHADLLIHNASIQTLDQQSTRAESLAVLDGKIIAVGSNNELSALGGPETRKLDLGGRTVLPGFIDSHEHLSWFAENLLKLDLSADKVASLDQLKSMVSEEARRLGPGEWIRGNCYDDTKMTDGRRLTRDDLDAAAPDNPVIIVHISGHWAVVNSKALEIGKLDENSPDPEGGSLGRESGAGRLNGLLLEMAMFNFAFENMAVTPTVVPSFPKDVLMRSIKEACAFLNSAGITGVGDALCAPSHVSAYLQMAREAQLTLRVNMMMSYIFLPHLEKAGLYGGWGDQWTRAGGIKLILDGAIAGKTAAMKDGYADDPDDHGLLLIEDQAFLDDVVLRSHKLGYQVCAHANGDMAINMALDAIEKAMNAAPRPDPRHRIEHCTMINEGILKRLAKLGVVALPFTSYVWQHAEKLKPYYGEKAHRMFAHKSFLDSGIIAAAASDHPVGLHSPLMGVQCMVTRKTPDGHVIGPDERLPLDEAFRVYTTYAAHASREDHIKGSLTPGRLADMTVLSEDPWETDPDRISQIKVDMTIVNGDVVYDAG
jgi:predicted amidohydrolase YtcJ